MLHPLLKKDILLRKYQESIIATSAEKNTLVVLPTGMGKTYIAIYVSLIRLSKFENSKILFLAPTKPLVNQHYETFRDILNLNEDEISVFTGTTNSKKRKELWQKAKIIIATPQTIENEIMKNLSLQNVSFLVFDEAHRAVKNYAYSFIAQEYMKQSKFPLIMGLTASPSSEIEKIAEIKKNLFIENVEIRTETDKDVIPYIKQTEVKWVKVDIPPEFSELRKKIISLLKAHLQQLRNLNYIDTIDITKISKKDLLSIQGKIRGDILNGNNADAYNAASLIAKIMKLQYALEILETQGIYTLFQYLQRLKLQSGKGIKELISNEDMKAIFTETERIKNLGIDHPKLNKLQEIVQEILKKEGQKILIFTQYRDSAEKIYQILSQNFKCSKFVGQADRETNKGMKQKEQIEILNKFRNNEFNILIATSVAEEGLDIPKVDYVIFYEPIPSEIRTIQRRGRTGRTEKGNIVILITQGTRDEGYYWSAIRKEQKMKEYLKNIERNEEIDKFVAKGQQTILNYTSSTNDECTEKKIKIYVDTRERSTDVFKILREKCSVELKQLEVGDYILSEDVCVERKTVQDFFESIIDRRLLSQASNLSTNFKTPIIIIEGDLNYSLRDIHPNAIRGAIASLLCDFKISIISTNDAKDTAELIYAIAKREQEEKEKIVPLRGEKKAYTLAEKQRFVIESLPNVSAVLSDRMLRKFKTIARIANASTKELMKVEEIGEKKATEIYKILHEEYKPE